MFEPTLEQAKILAQIIVLVPLVVQGVRWLFKYVFKRPLGEGWIKTFVIAVAFALSLAFSAPMIPDFPTGAFGLDLVWAWLSWAVAMVFIVQGYIHTTKLIYEYLWRRLVFDNVAALAGANLH